MILSRLLTSCNAAARSLTECAPKCKKPICNRESLHLRLGTFIGTTSVRNLNYNISNHINPTIKKYDSSTSNIDLRDVELDLGGGRKVVLNLTWLRDSCHCERCTHQHSRQRLFNAKDFRKSMFGISNMQIVRSIPQNILTPLSPTIKGGNSWLRVSWSDGHESHYSIEWLKYQDSLYTDSVLPYYNDPINKFHVPQDDFYSARTEFVSPVKSWAVNDINRLLEPVHYQDLVDNFTYNQDPTFINANKIEMMSKRRFDAILSLSSQLVSNGLVKVINVPTERNQVLNLVRSLAYERPTGYGTVFDVVLEPSEEINLAYSFVEFDLHSDLTYREMSPGVQLLHCIRNSTEGGLSYFSDALYAAESLRQVSPELFQVLVQFPATFVVRDPYRNVKFRKQQPVICVGKNGQIGDIYYSPFMLPPIGFRDDVKMFYLAFDRFTQILQSKSNKLISKMEPGDLFIFHNRRVLHGRSAYNPKTSSRFLQGCYMDWDEIECIYEKFLSYKNLGHHDNKCVHK